MLVTGGSSGYGRAIAERLAAPGTDVFINYHRDDARAQQAAEAVTARGAVGHLVKADVGTLDGVERIAAAVAAHSGRLDQLVHCAAHPVSGPLLELAPADLERALAVNGTALIHLVRATADLLVDGASVVYLSSGGGHTVIRNYGALGVAKALAEHIVRYLAVELAPRGVRVNAVSPGPVDTPAFRAMFPEDWERRLQRAGRANPSGRPMHVDDAAALVAALAHADHRMVQGQIITVDGGLSLM